GAGNRSSLPNVVVLEAAEEERLLLQDRAANVKAILVELEVRPRQALGIVEPLVGIEPGVAVEVENVAVKSVGAGARRDHDIRATVAPVFRGRIQRDGAKLLHVVRIETLDVRLRIGHRRFVGVDAINRDVVGAVAGAEDMRSRSSRIRGPLGYAGLEREQ